MQGPPSPGGPAAPPLTPEQRARRARVIQLVPRIMQHYRQLAPPPQPGWYMMQLRPNIILYARTGGDLDYLEKRVFTDHVGAQPLHDELVQRLQGQPNYAQQIAALRAQTPGLPGHPGQGAPGARPGMGPGGPPGGGGFRAPSGPANPPSPSPEAAGGVCPYCGSPTPAGAPKCPSCTAPL